MTLLAPMSAIIAGALAVPTLMVFYLLKLRRRPVRVSSTMFWSAQQRDLQANVPLRLIRPSWLLLLQLLGLALLIAALGRPAFDVAGGAASRVVLVIDRSASMSARDEPDGPTRFERAVELAREEVDRIARAGRGADVLVVSMAARAEVATSFSGDLGAARRALASLTPTDQPADLAATLSLVEALLGDGGGSEEESAPEPAEVVLFTDGSFATDRSLSVAGAQARYVRVGGADNAPERVVSAENVGIVAMAARRDYVDPATVRVFGRFVNSAERDVTVAATLRLDDELVDGAAIDLPAAVRDDDGLSPEARSVTFELTTRAGGVLTLAIDRDDALPADNTARLVLEPAPTTRIAMVTPQVSGPADQITERILTDILAELADGGFSRLTDIEYRTRVGSLLGTDLVVFDRTRPEALPPVASLSFGAPNAEVEEGGPTYVLSWERSHPVLRDVSLDTLYAERTKPPEVGPEEAEVLARGRDGPLIYGTRQAGARRLHVAFELAQSNWPTDPASLAIFLANAVDYLTLRGEANVGRSFSTGEPIVFPFDGSGEPTLVDPDGDVRPMRATAGEASAGLVERVGLYEIRVNGEARDVLAVNLLDEVESMALSVPALSISGRTVEAGAGGATPRELWPWFVLAGALVLSVEWMLSAWLSRV